MIVSFIIVAIISFALGMISMWLVADRLMARKHQADKSYYLRKGWDTCEDYIIETGIDTNLLIAKRRKQGR